MVDADGDVVDLDGIDAIVKRHVSVKLLEELRLFEPTKWGSGEGKLKQGGRKS